MNLNLDRQIAESYKSASQKIRVLSEDWVEKEAYCPQCGNIHLKKYPNNRPVADFFCEKCNEDFELKSKKNGLGKKIVDGAYQSMLKRMRDVNNPSFFMLNYNFDSYQVLNFFIIPKHFFIPDIIERRKPLSSNARRVGWVGCNILLNRIPLSGRIFLVRNKVVEPKEKVRALWEKTSFLRQEKKPESRGWILDIMKYIELIGKKKFTLGEIYKYESILSKQHPKNRHIKDKIRQQLQILRDKNYIQFIGKGEYRII